MNRRSASRVLGMLLITAMPTCLGAAEAGDPAARAFGRLSALVGEWKGKFADGREHSVAYRLTAGGAVLVETWTLAPGRESMTLYHRDGDALLADHYCPQGNTPRLELARGGASDRLSFVFRDGANLDLPGKSHQHTFWVKVTGPDSYVRSETYVENGSEVRTAEPDAPITYTRIRPRRR